MMKMSNRIFMKQFTVFCGVKMFLRSMIDDVGDLGKQMNDLMFKRCKAFGAGKSRKAKEVLGKNLNA